MNPITQFDGPAKAPESKTPDVLAELNVEARTVLAFTVREEAASSLLPSGWQVAPAGEGPSRGGNLNVIFTDRMLVQLSDGQRVVGESVNQLAVVAVPALHPQGGRVVVIAFGFSAKADGAPGPYDVFDPAEVSSQRSTRMSTGGVLEGEEMWNFAGNDGTLLRLQLRYKKGIPTRAETQTIAYSARNSGFHRTYKADQGTDVLLSLPDSIKTTLALDFHASGPRFDSLFDGTERMVSVVSIPWTVRRAYLPA